MSVNKVILIGNVGQDPKVTYYDGGNCVAQLPLATSDKAYTLQNGTQVPERTEWHNLVFRNRLAEIVDKYVHKGDKLYVEGKIRTRSYDDQKGIQRYITEIFVDNMEMLTPRGASASGVVAPQQGAVSQAAVSSTQQAAAAPAQVAAQSQAIPAQDNTTDDLPF